MTFTKDQMAAMARHYGNSAASFVVGAAAGVIVMGRLGPEQMERVLVSLDKFADGWGKLVPVLLIVVPYLMGRSASKSASPEEQIRKVQQDPTNGVEVVSLTAEGEKTLEKIKGEMK